MRRKLLHLSLIVIIAVSAVAQQKHADTTAPSVERLRAHITYLASDKLEGRRTGSRGADMAAEYIAREFARYGLRRSIGVDLPGMSILEADSPRRYMQEFPYVAGVELGQGNSLTARLTLADVSVLTLRLGEDWMPLGFSSSGRVENSRVVLAGYGITAGELKYDDYAGLDVKDKIALAFSGTPDGDNPHGKFARAGEVRFKAAAARAAGARALVIIAKEDNFKDDALSRLAFDNMSGEAGLPVIAISRQAAAKWLNFKDATGIGWAEGWLSKYYSLLFEFAQKTGGDKIIVGYGYTKHSEPPMFDPYNLSSTLAVDIIRKNAPAWNVVGILEGTDPKLKNEAIVIGAHYDHLGRGGEGSRAAREGEVHHGADDNASGVAGMLELARIFSSHDARPRRTLIFIAFSGEEEGLLGSNFYVNHPVRPLAQAVGMINMDMIGRMKGDKLIVGGVGTAEQWRTIIEQSNLPVGVSVPPVTPGGTGEGGSMPRPLALTLNEDGYGPSDHASFYAKQVPVLFFWTGTHEDYHKPSDTADKINYEDEARIISFVAQVISSIDESAARPTYTVSRSEQTGRSMGFRVYLGTIPNYSDSTTGLVLDGVRDDSPAAKAGLKAGDRIIRLAGHDVRNVYDYTYALGEMKAGEVYEVELVRAGQTLKLKLIPAARKQ